MSAPSLDSITLKRGSHDSRETGTCVMEAVAWLAGEPHSDHPKCTDSMLAAFARRINDAYWPTDKDRTEAFRPILPLLLDTAGKMDRPRLRWCFADAAVRDFAPSALDIAAGVLERLGKFAEHATKLREHAKALRKLPPVTADNWRVANAKAWEARAAAYAAAHVAAAAAYANAAAAAYAAANAAAAAYAAVFDAAYATAAYAADAAAYAAAAAAADDADAARFPLLKAATALLRRACTECRIPEVAS